MGTITAKDDVWDNYIKEYPDAGSMRSTGCPICKQLCIIIFWAMCLFMFIFIYLFIFFIFNFEIISKFPIFK